MIGPRISIATFHGASFYGGLAKIYSQPTSQIRFVHHHKELEQPNGFERFIGWKRSNPNKANRNTHTNEKRFKKLRGQKRLLIELEDHVEVKAMQKMKPDQMRMYLLRRGKPDIYKDVAPREWNEHQITFQSMNTIMDQHIPPETSFFSRARSSDIIGDIKDYWKRKYVDIMGYGEKRIRKKEGFAHFQSKKFLGEAEQIYISAFTALAKRDKRNLHTLMTETAYLKLWPDVEKGTLVWEFVHFNQPSEVTSVRCLDLPVKSGNDIAQITVRMHSTQKMALYDKDGHLLVGSQDEPQEVLEYVVFENQVSNYHGRWRFHGKVHPNWLKPKQPIKRPTLIEEDKKKTSIPLEPLKLHFGMAQEIKKREEEKEKKK